jgi:NADH/F420H2 dehydrogenase subunit C
VVVGAGIVGACCAYELARAGLSVCVVDRGGVASGTTGAGEGNILVSDKAAGPELELALLSRALWFELLDVLPGAVELEAKGGVIVTGTEAGLSSLAALSEGQRASGVEAYDVDAAGLLELEPHLAPTLLGGVHYPQDLGRELHAVYHLQSITHGRRVRLEVACPDADPHLPSLVPVYPTADWQERETWDFFGIQFDGHPALTRIHMPDDWPGHPQRKDYPLGGIPVEYKGATIPPPDTRRSYS